MYNDVHTCNRGSCKHTGFPEALSSEKPKSTKMNMFRNMNFDFME